MSNNALRKYRLTAGLTQAQVASSMGVSQPNYQRWESGAAAVPAKKQRALAKVLKVSLEELQGKSPPFDYFGVDRTVDGARSYYGEVSLHFQGNGKSLLLSISLKEHDTLRNQLQTDSAMIIISSLDNQLVFVRQSALADVFFSSDAYDDFGPEHDTYEQPLGIFPDDDCWHIVEFIDCPELAEQDYKSERIAEVNKFVCLSEDDLNHLIAIGEIPESQKERKREEADAISATFHARATDVIWQLSNGKQRRTSGCENVILYETFSLLELSSDNLDSFICLPVEGYHRSIFINPNAIDYISVPTHKFKAGELDSIEHDLL